MGCGTGILSIAAAMNGVQKVDAFDNDPLAVKTAKHNSKMNHTQRKIKFQTLDLAKFKPKKVDLVFANIISGVLLKYKKKIKDSVKKEGLLFVTGVTRQESSQFLKQFQSKNFELIDKKQTRLWIGYVFRKRQR